MGLIQRADLPEKIRRAFGIRERGVGATISPEIVPVVLVEDLTGPTIDEGYPRLVAGTIICGASAGVMSEVFIINPLGIRTDLVLDEIWVWRSAAGECQFRHGLEAELNNLLGTQLQKFNLDLRTETFPGHRIDSRNQAAALGTTLLTFPTLSLTNWLIMPARFTIPPGQWISVVPTANDMSLRIAYYGYERLRTTT